MTVGHRARQGVRPVPVLVPVLHPRWHHAVALRPDDADSVQPRRREGPDLGRGRPSRVVPFLRSQRGAATAAAPTVDRLPSDGPGKLNSETGDENGYSD